MKKMIVAAVLTFATVAHAGDKVRRPEDAPPSVPRAEPGGVRKLCAYLERNAPARPVAFYGDCRPAASGNEVVVGPGGARAIVQ